MSKGNARMIHPASCRPQALHRTSPHLRPGTLRSTGGLWEVEAECWSGSTALGVVGHGEVRTLRRDGTQDVDSMC